QLDRIASLCSEAILLDHGQVRLHGSPSECIQEYTLGVAPTGDSTESTLSITSMRFDDTDIVMSGEHINLHLTCRSRDDFDNDATDIVVTVRSATTGSMLFSTGARPCRIEIPRGQEFEIDVELQANLTPGLYHVETGVWDSVRQWLVHGGPSRMLTVQPGTRSFGGSVQLNAQMSIHTLAIGSNMPDGADEMNHPSPELIVRS